MLPALLLPLLPLAAARPFNWGWDHHKNSDVPTALNPYPFQKRITYDASGKFRVLVMSDLHFGEPAAKGGVEKDANTTKAMKWLLENEPANFGVVNGDLITADLLSLENSTAYVDAYVAPFVEAGLPFATTQGNHDNQPNITHSMIVARERAVSYNLSYTGQSHGVGGYGGESNYFVPVFAKDDDTKPSTILFFFDSRGGKQFGNSGEQVEDWVDDSVATWLDETIDAFERYGWGDRIPTIAFVHIPVSAAREVQKQLDPARNPGLNEDNPLQTQSDNNKAAGPRRDLPFYNALTSRVKNLHAIVSGHQHGLEWCAKDTTVQNGPTLCQNKRTGYGGYGEEAWGRGGRVFEFDLQKVDREVYTYIRTLDGGKRAEYTLGKGFGRQ